MQKLICNLPVTIQIRTTSLGIPTRDVLGVPVVLNPNSVVGTDEDGNDILLKNNTSTDASKLELKLHSKNQYSYHRKRVCYSFTF